MNDSRLLTRTDLAAARDYFVIACLYSRAHDQLAKNSLEQYGDHGPPISGCVRDHFPDRIKNALRRMAEQVTWHVDEAYRKRPCGVRHVTMIRLGQAVAQRDGVGYYGPRI